MPLTTEQKASILYKARECIFSSGYVKHVQLMCDGNCDKEYIDWNNKNWEDFVNFVEGL